MCLQENVCEQNGGARVSGARHELHRTARAKTADEYGRFNNVLGTTESIPIITIDKRTYFTWCAAGKLLTRNAETMDGGGRH